MSEVREPRCSTSGAQCGARPRCNGACGAQVFAATYRGADSELPLQSSELYFLMPAQRENFADFGRCEQFPTKMKVRAVDPRCLEKTIFRVFCANFCCQDCHIVALHAHKSSKLLPNYTNEARRALARAQILPIWTPKMPKNRFETQFWAPDRRHFFPPGEVRAAACIPAAKRRLTVWPICPQKDLEPSNLCRGGPSCLSPQKPFLSGISRSAHICK